MTLRVNDRDSIESFSTAIVKLSEYVQDHDIYQSILAESIFDFINEMLRYNYRVRLEKKIKKKSQTLLI